jgi:K+-sensing histidine kinase KdpD
MNNRSQNPALRRWLNNIPIQDPVDRQMAALLQVILIGFISILLIAAVVNVLLPRSLISLQAILVRTSIFVLIIGIPLVLLRRGFLHSSIYLIIAILLILETFVVLVGDLRSIAETLTFFTFAILLAGLFVGRTALLITFLVSIVAISLNIIQEQEIALKLDSTVIAENFILLNGLMALFLDRFGVTLRTALQAALERENELKTEVIVRQQTEATLQQFTERLGILHEIDRSLLLAHSLHDIAKGALIRVRQLIPCKRASVSLFDFDKMEASFLTADFDGIETIPDTPMPLTEFGLDVIEVLWQNRAWSTNEILKEPLVTDLDKRLADEADIHVWLSLPLHYQGQLIGALNLGRGTGQPFTTEDAAITHDIANQLAIVLQQTRLYNALQDQLAEREKLIAQLEASNAELERFTYTVSHDLRNPLVTIKGFLGMLEKDLRDNRPDKVQDDFRRIAGAAEKMETLLSGLLELSRIGRILNPPEEVELGPLIQEAIETLHGRLHSNGITINVAQNFPYVYGDRLR